MTYGTDPHHLHNGTSETSAEAAYAVDSTKLEKMVHDAIKEFGEGGAIADDLLEKFNRFPYSSITARFAALERKGYIFRNGDKAKGKSGRSQQIMRSAEYRKEVP